MTKQIKIGQKDIHFVRIGGKVIYPNYDAKENLVLHYDFSGRTNLDVNKGIAEDLSGNGNDGILENFAYESGSGYDSNSYLEFDNVDDFITIPELNLDVNNFTVAVDGEVLSYRGDNVAKINENGMEIGGRNLALKTSIPFFGTGTDTATRQLIKASAYILSVNPTLGDTYTVSFKAKATGSTKRFTPMFAGTQPLINVLLTDEYKYYSNTIICAYSAKHIHFYGFGILTLDVKDFKLEKGTIPTDWSPAPEDFQTTQITPIFSNKIKTLMYWNRALTDTELQEVYNVQKHRI